METSVVALSQTELARLSAVERHLAGVLSQYEAAQRLRISIRQFKRLVRRYRDAGAPALASRRRKRPSNRAFPRETLARALELVRVEYADVGPTFAAEKLAERHAIAIDHETLRRAMIRHGLWTVSATRRRKRHLERDRRPCFGELIQIDGSHHAWFEDRGPRCALLVAIDDATSKLVGLRFETHETTWGYFALLQPYFESIGRPLAFYSDRDSIFRQTRTTAETMTQFERAMKSLDIELICANSPQAKGRVERVNGTLQNRLVKELRLRNISTIEDANAYLAAYLPSHNARFSRLPLNSNDVHRTTSLDLDSTLCLHYTRTITHSGTVHFENRVLVIEDDSLSHVIGRKVEIRERRDGTIALFLRGRMLRFTERTTHHPEIVTHKALDTNCEPRFTRAGHPPAPTHPWTQPFSPNALGRPQGTSLSS